MTISAERAAELTARMRAEACSRIELAHRGGQLDDAQRSACDRGYSCTPAPGVTAFGETYEQFRERFLDERIADNQRAGMGYKAALLDAANQFDDLFRE